MTKAQSPAKATTTTADDNSAYNPANYSEVGADGNPVADTTVADQADNVKVDKPAATAKSARENKGILGESKEALGADTKALLETTPKKIGGPQPEAKSEPMTMAQINSPENLANNALVGDARGFLRAKGIADHLYTDQVAIDAFIEYRDTVGRGLKADYQPKMPVKVTTHFDTTPTATVVPVAVKRAEFSTTEGDKVPHYTDPLHGKDAESKT